jgi:PHD/YefM family antitoxin component YafN of YafNO toxin-antitoxin module
VLSLFYKQSLINIKGGFHMVTIPENKIISISDVQRKFKEISEKIETDQIGFIFKNNKPDKVIMTFEKYKKIIEALELLEHAEIYKEIQESENSETVSFEDAMSQLKL